MNKYLKQYEWSNIRAMIRNSKAEPKECFEDFKDRLVIITGATSGIGSCTAKEYAAHGSDLLFINRNKEKSISLCKEIQKKYSVKCNFKIADFSHLSDIRSVADELLDSNIDCDVFIHNAGVYCTKRTFSEDDIEMVFQVNYLGSFILNYTLKEKLKAQNKARIIFVNSEGHRFAVLGAYLDDLKWKKHLYTGLRSYGSAKTCQLLSMIKFNDYFKESNTTINAMHPGNVKSNMGENNGFLYRLFKHHYINRIAASPEKSAKSLYYLGVSKEIEGISGKFFNLTTEEIPAPPALDREAAEKLWQISKQLCELK